MSLSSVASTEAACALFHGVGLTVDRPFDNNIADLDVVVFDFVVFSFNAVVVIDGFHFFCVVVFWSAEDLHLVLMCGPVMSGRCRLN